VNIGVQKKIMNNKGSLRLGARDIFHTNTSAGNITNVPGVKVAFSNYLDTRVVFLSFNCSFGKQTTSKQKRNTGGSDTETDRIKN